MVHCFNVASILTLFTQAVTRHVSQDDSDVGISVAPQPPTPHRLGFHHAVFRHIAVYCIGKNKKEIELAKLFTLVGGGF